MKISSDLDVISAIINQDGVILYPTEGVYGLGCNPQSESAVHKIFAIKQRSDSQGLILIASHFSQIEAYINISDDIKIQLQQIWPGFTTCILPKSSSCPTYLSGQHDSIAIRISNHPTVVRLCNHLNSALVSTSANKSGEQPINKKQALIKAFNNLVPIMVDGKLGQDAKPSTIIKFENNQRIIIRP